MQHFGAGVWIEGVWWALLLQTLRRKTELSSFKTIERDRFGDYIDNVKIFSFFSKAKIEKFHMNKKVTKLHFVRISEHWDH